MKSRQRTQSVLNLGKEHRFVAWLADQGTFVNLAGNYDYLSQPYYISMDYEDSAKQIRPGCKEMLDAYVPPLFLEKAKLFGVPVPEFYISNGYFEPPVIIDPVNPFTLKGRIVRKQGRASSIAKSLTRNFTYAICCQELPEGSRVNFFRSVLGWCANKSYRKYAQIIWEIFRIPVARIRIVILESGECLLSDIAPLPFEYLRPRELQYVEEHVEWRN